MGLSFAHLLVLLIVIFVLFGAGKLPQVLGDLGKGIKNLRSELEKDETNLELQKVEIKNQQKNK